MSFKTRCPLHWRSKLCEDMKSDLRGREQSGVHFFPSTSVCGTLLAPLRGSELVIVSSNFYFTA